MRVFSFSRLVNFACGEGRTGIKDLQIERHILRCELGYMKLLFLYSLLILLQ